MHGCKKSSQNDVPNNVPNNVPTTMYGWKKSSQNDVPNNLPNNVPMMWRMLMFVTSLTSYSMWITIMTSWPVILKNWLHDSGAAREQMGVHESESEQQFAAREEEGRVGEEINAEQRALDPVGDVILDIGANENIDIGANENVGNVENIEENQDDRRDVVDFPGVEEEHEYEWSSDIAQINHRLELFTQQLQFKDDKINELERRIKELEHWKITRISPTWP
jgi:hypothetical protein